MDLGHYTPFAENTYTTITAFDNSQKFDKIKFYKYNPETKKPKFIRNLKYSDFFVDTNIILPVSEFKNTFSEIYNIDINNDKALNLLKKLLANIDADYNKTKYINFLEYKHLMLISAQVMELTIKEKDIFIFELFYSIYKEIV